MTAPIHDETPHAAPDAQAAYWQSINAALDRRVAALGADMSHYLLDDLSERVPRPQPLFYQNGTVYEPQVIAPAMTALQTRLKSAMRGEPQPQDQKLLQRLRAPLYAAFLRDLPPEKQKITETFLYQMQDAASAYVTYTERVLKDSFPQGQVPASQTSLRQLSDAIAQPLLRAYCCMDMLRAPTSEAVMGLTDNRMAIMEAFDFMKEVADAEVRNQLAGAPKPTPKSVVQADTVQKPAPASVFGERPRMSEAELARLREEAAARRASENPAPKKGWFSR